uniref:protein HID1-like n=1 Tax=Pristiophorus japonicus TaxID=55135 RepID=UPI00398F0113
MGSADSKLHFRKAVIQLTTKTQPVEATDDAFWDQFWADTATSIQDVFTLVPAAEIRAVREESPSNLATLCYKAVEKLVQGAESGCGSEKEKQVIINCTQLLTRILPYIFEDPDWRGFFWSTVPGAGRGGADEGDDENARPLAESLLLAIADLLFCPDFTVQSHRKAGPETAEDIHSIDSCEYIWEAGVGFAHSPPHSYMHDLNRTELLKLLLTCFSEAVYLLPTSEGNVLNPWVQFFCSTENRHALPLFTSLLNIVCAYDPVGYGIPYNHLLFSDYREPLVEVAGQVLIATLDHDASTSLTPSVDGTTTSTAMDDAEPPGPENLFVNYLSRIHREEDFQFILKGLARLLNNPLLQTYLPNSTKKIQFHQELLVLFWKLCDFNKKFLFYALKSSDVLDILVPILFYLNDARADQSRVGLMHIGVFILLLLSGERNFGVRLNKPYSVRVPMDIPVFTGTHADLLIIVFHKIITSGHQRLQPLFDCLLTIVVNEIGRVSASGGRQRALTALPGRDESTDALELGMDFEATVIPSATISCTLEIEAIPRNPERRRKPSSLSSSSQWTPSPDWVISWKSKLPLQTIMRLLQVLVPQVEKICIDKGLTDESEILKFLQHGTLVGLLPVPHPILIRKYQANSGTAMWFRTYMWGVIYLRNVDPPIWYDTDVKLFEIQRV